MFLCFYIFKERGIAALPVTVGVLLMVLIIGATLLAVGFSELFVSKSGAEAKEGLYLAEFGAQDALMRITRDKNVTSTGYNPDPNNTDLTVTVTDSPTVDCESDTLTPDGCDSGTIKLICSRAQIKRGGGSQKTITVQVVADVDDMGKVMQCSWKQL